MRTPGPLLRRLLGRTRSRSRERPPAGMGRPGWYPDHGAERKADFARTTPAERIAEAIELSEVATELAATAARRR